MLFRSHSEQSVAVTSKVGYSEASDNHAWKAGNATRSSAGATDLSLRELDDTDELDAAASNYSTGNCLSDFNEWINPKTTNVYI